MAALVEIQRLELYLLHSEAAVALVALFPLRHPAAVVAEVLLVRAVAAAQLAELEAFQRTPPVLESTVRASLELLERARTILR